MVTSLPSMSKTLRLIHVHTPIHNVSFTVFMLELAVSKDPIQCPLLFSVGPACMQCTDVHAGKNTHI